MTRGGQLVLSFHRQFNLKCLKDCTGCCVLFGDRLSVEKQLLCRFQGAVGCREDDSKKTKKPYEETFPPYHNPSHRCINSHRRDSLPLQPPPPKPKPPTPFWPIRLINPSFPR